MCAFYLVGSHKEMTLLLSHCLRVICVCSMALWCIDLLILNVNMECLLPPLRPLPGHLPPPSLDTK